MRLMTILMCAVCCAVLATGCWPVPAEPPTLDTEDPPDKNVQPPSWYKPAQTPAPWPLGPAPEHGTREWRQWCSMRYNSRAIVRPAATPPVIDGALHDAAWADTATGIPFVTPGGPPATHATTVFLAYDKTNLYVAARLDEPEPAMIQAEEGNTQGAIRRGDYFALHILPDWRSTSPAQHWLVINSTGAMVASAPADANNNDALTATVVVDEKSWTVEIAIPLSRLGLNKDDLWGQTWAVTFIRHRRAANADEPSAWTRILDYTKGRINFGHVIFKGVRPEAPKEPPEEPEKPADTEKPADPEKPAEPKKPAELETPAEPEGPATEPGSDKKNASKEKTGDKDGN